MESIINSIGSDYKNSKDIFQSIKRRELVAILVPKALPEEESMGDILNIISTK